MILELNHAGFAGGLLGKGEQKTAIEEVAESRERPLLRRLWTVG